MNKLNNTEIGALAQKIQAETKKGKKLVSESINLKVQERVNKIWNKFVSSNDYKVLLKYKVTPSLSMVIDKEIKEGDFTYTTNYRSGDYNNDRLQTKGGTLYINKNEGPVSYDDIRRELILGQIDATDLESLIDKVKTSLKLN